MHNISEIPLSGHPFDMHNFSDSVDPTAPSQTAYLMHNFSQATLPFPSSAPSISMHNFSATRELRAH